MPVYVCSLAVAVDQSIPAGGDYHLVKFPPYPDESYDAHAMHQMAQPDGYQITNWQSDPRSGLIWPAVDGWGELHACIHWKSGSYTELRDRFVRDPLNLSTGLDATATDHRPPSPGIQCFTKGHGIFVHPGTPIGLMVGHTGASARTIEYAQLKLVIHPVAEPAPAS